jgi:hypothetical protein
MFKRIRKWLWRRKLQREDKRLRDVHLAWSLAQARVKFLGSKEPLSPEPPKPLPYSCVRKFLEG